MAKNMWVFNIALGVWLSERETHESVGFLAGFPQSCLRIATSFGCLCLTLEGASTLSQLASNLQTCKESQNPQETSGTRAKPTKKTHEKTWKLR